MLSFLLLCYLGFSFLFEWRAWRRPCVYAEQTNRRAEKGNKNANMESIKMWRRRRDSVHLLKLRLRRVLIQMDVVWVYGRRGVRRKGPTGRWTGRPTGRPTGRATGRATRRQTRHLLITGSWLDLNTRMIGLTPIQPSIEMSRILGVDRMRQSGTSSNDPPSSRYRNACWSFPMSNRLVIITCWARN